PSTQRIVSSSSPAKMRSMISAASFGEVSESDGCQSSRTCPPSRKSDRLSPVLPGPSAPRIAIDSPLQEPHSIHNKVAFLFRPDENRNCSGDDCPSCPEYTDIKPPEKPRASATDHLFRPLGITQRGTEIDESHCRARSNCSGAKRLQ